MSGLFTYVFSVVTGDFAIVASIATATFFMLGAWGVLYAYTPELYPTEVRATGMGAASGMARISGVMAPLIGGYLLTNVNNGLVLALTVFALAFVVAAIAVLVMGRETRDQALADTVEGAIFGETAAT